MNAWSIVGYVRFDNTVAPSLAAPVLSKDKASVFQQIDYRTAANRFDVTRFDPGEGGFERLEQSIACDPWSDQIVCLLQASDAICGSVTELRERLTEVADDVSTPRSLRLQIKDLLGDDEGVSAISASVLNDLTDQERRTYDATLSASAVFEVVMKNLKPDVAPSEAVRATGRAARFIRKWRPDLASLSHIHSMLELTTLSFSQFELALKAKRNSLGWELSATTNPDTELSNIRGISRQEGRIGRLLSVYIQSPDAAAAILQIYRTRNQFESLVLHRISSTLLSNREDIGDAARRGMAVAALIGWLVNVSYPASRGTLLNDLARELSWNPTVREAIERAFEQKRHTWTVSNWEQSILRHLRGAHMPEDKPHTYPLL